MEVYELYFFLLAAAVMFSGVLYVDHQIREHWRAFCEGLIDGGQQAIEESEQ